MPEPQAAPVGNAGWQVCEAVSQYDVVTHAEADVAHDAPFARRAAHVLPLVPLKSQ